MKAKFQTYKGFGINLKGGQYIADAYANPTFYGNSIARIKKAINQYLRDEKYNDVHEFYEV